MITLRKILEGDTYAITLLANNQRIWNNVRNAMPYPYHLEHAREFIKRVQEQDPVENFAIDKEGTLTGICGVHMKKDVYCRTAEIGYWIGEPYWGQGIATKAVSLLIEYSFSQLHLVRLEAECYAGNEASVRVLEKNQFVKEGHFKSRIWKNNRILDSYLFALINPNFL